MSWPARESETIATEPIKDLPMAKDQLSTWGPFCEA